MKRTTVSERALVLAPRGRDAAIAGARSGRSVVVMSLLTQLLTTAEPGATLSRDPGLGVEP